MALKEPYHWARDRYWISSFQVFLQPSVIKAGFASDDVHWAKSASKDSLKAIFENSLCFGLYELGKTSPDFSSPGGPRQVGFARLVTDKATTAYLTDMFVLKEHQGKGLGTWLTDCINQVLQSWPGLRRVLVETNDSRAERFYGERMGVAPSVKGEDGIAILSKGGPGSSLKK